jgi:ATP adenylyltransferase
MDRLWAPWRIKYLKAKKKRGCILCNSLKSKRNNYVIFKTSHSFAVLNIFPYNNGHLMVSPLKHVSDLSGLSDIQALDLFKALSRSKALLERVLKPHGYNIGFNTSLDAGAGEAGHIHIHIVPRWKGDTNFITAIYDTKVISQSLDELCRQLKKAAIKIKC